VSSIKDGFIKRGPKTINYRDYNNFNNKRFRTALKKAIAEQNAQRQQFGTFNSVVKKYLDNHAPIKQKTIRANNGLLMTKALRLLCNGQNYAANSIKKEVRRT